MSWTYLGLSIVLSDLFHLLFYKLIHTGDTNHLYDSEMFSVLVQVQVL